jgi:uncharacterized protein YqcC (DUF446 family)
MLASGETPAALLRGELQRYHLSVTKRGNRGKPGTQAVAERLAAVVQSMKDAGVWETPRPPDSAFENMGAFGMNTMPFTDWLRWVFVPNVERLIASEGPWPRSSQVSVQATREGDTDLVVQSLVPALSAFDELFA